MKSINVKKLFAIGAIGVVGLAGLFGLTGCNNNDAQINELSSEVSSQQMTIEELREKINDLNSTNVEFVENIEENLTEVDKEIINETINVTNETVENVTEVEEPNYVYFIDEVSLTGSFEDVIDSDDFEELYFNVVSYDGEDYDAEEVITLTNEIKPVKNIDDKDEDIYLSVEEGSIKYAVEFDNAVDFSDNVHDEDLEFNFLGKDVIISNYDGDITFYSGTEYNILEGKTVIYEDATITIEAVSDNSKALIKVARDGEVESKIVKESDTRNFLGIDVFLKESFDSDNNNGFVVLRVGTDEIEYEVSNGDEYDADDRYDWVVTGDGNKLESVGLVLAEDYTDEDDILALDKTLCLPLNYKCISFEEIVNDDTNELELTLTSSNKLKLDYASKIDVNDRRAEDLEYDFNDNVLEYEISNGDTKEINISDSEVILFSNNREIYVEASSSFINVGEYSLGIVDDYFNVSGTLFDEDDNKMTDNGDIFYKVDDDVEDRDDLNIGFVEEDVEVVLKVD